MYLQLDYLRLYKLSRDIYFPKRKKGKKGEERGKKERKNQLGEEL